MAEGGNENGFQISENFKYVLFTEYLVNYVMLQNLSGLVGERFQLPSYRIADIYFNVTIKRAIYILGKELEEAHKVSFNQIHQNNEVSLLRYTMFVSRLEQSLFSRGFGGRLFLLYCADISNFAAYFYNCGILEAPNLAKSQIFNILRHFMPPEGWNILNMAAEEYIEIFRQ